MALKASLVITGDAASATAALGQVDAALERNAGAAKRAAAANDELGRKVQSATGQARAGYVQLGQQAQDVAVQLQAGTNIGTIVAQQGGQVATAVAMMGGRFSGLASFIAGPYGAAVLLATGLVLNFAQSMWNSSAAAENNADKLNLAKTGADALGAAQSVLGNLFDTVSGKIKTQNELLILNARLTSLNLKSEALQKSASAKSTFLGAMRSTQAATISGTAAARAGVLPQASSGQNNAASIRQLLVDVGAGRVSRDAALQRSATMSFAGTGATRQEFQQAIIDSAVAQNNNRVAALIDKSLNDRSLASSLRKPGSPPGPRSSAPRSRPSSSAAAPTKIDFGDDIAAKIARIVDQFSDLPPVVAQSNQAMRQLDDIASDVEKKRPPNYDGLKASLAGARQAIQSSLAKPFNDYLERAREGAAIDQLLLAGKRDQAAALQVALSLQRQMGPLTEEQLASIQRTVTAERERGELLRRQQEMIGNYLDATRSVRSEIEGILAGTGKLSNLPQVFKDLQGKVLAEKLFGPMFRDVDKWVQDNSGMKSATSAYVDSTVKAGTAAFDLAAAFRAAGGQIRAAATMAPGASAFDRAFANIPDPTGALGSSAGQDAPEIVVNARLPSKANGPTLLDISVNEYMRMLTQNTARSFTDALNGAAGTKFFSQFAGSLGGAMEGYMVSGGSPFGAALGALKELPGLPKGIAQALNGTMVGGKMVGGAFNGLATGAQVAGLAGAFGIRLNNTGAQIGGAIGSFLPIPGGQIIGSIAGGLLGGLFGKRPRGAASVTNSGVTGGTNDAALTQSILGQGGDLRTTIATIAERLGGKVGSYDVGLGRYKEYYQVSSQAGDPRLGNSYFHQKSPNALYDGTDPAAAAAAAIAEAIRDGAIEGISARVSKALTSNRDIEKALGEALKVQQLEDLLGGPGGAIGKAMADFERQAKERLRVATAYGFDVVKIEELNSKERLKLSQQLLEQQVGSLQRLIDEMTGGSLFEGSAVDKRTALLDQIAKAKTEAAAGTEGAADKLAGLLDQLNAVSKDVYGTTGGFAADRSTILDQAREVIALANQRIADANTKSDPALIATNAALDENNDQNAEIIGLLRELRASPPPPADHMNLADLARLASTRAQ